MAFFFLELNLVYRLKNKYLFYYEGYYYSVNLIEFLEGFEKNGPFQDFLPDFPKLSFPDEMPFPRR
jgi:hypothetical protein